MNKRLSNDIEELISYNNLGDMLDGKTILITGANGLIARNLTLYLLMYNKIKKTNIHVLALIRNRDKAFMNYKEFVDDKNFEFLIQDVCDKLEYDGNVDYIFHAAGNASAEAIRKNPVEIIKANLLGMINVLEFAKTHNTTKVIFPSTREIYGKIIDKDLIKETDMGVLDTMDERNCYPESKRMAEVMLVSYAKQYNVNFDILRIAHTYGPAMPLENDGRIMSDMIYFAANKKDIVLNSDGTAVRAFCYVTDAVDGILRVMVNGNDNEAYNLSNVKEPIMIRDLAQKLVDLSNGDISLKFKEASMEVLKGYTSYKMVNMDNSKLESLGWNPCISLDEGLKRTLKYFEIEKNGIK